MCSTVNITEHKVHIGGFVPSSRCEDVSLVCPIINLVTTTDSHLVRPTGVFQIFTLFLILDNFELVAFHCCNHRSVKTFLNSPLRFLGRTRVSVMIFDDVAESAALSAF